MGIQNSVNSIMNSAVTGAIAKNIKQSANISEESLAAQKQAKAIQEQKDIASATRQVELGALQNPQGVGLTKPEAERFLAERSLRDVTPVDSNKVSPFGSGKQYGQDEKGTPKLTFDEVKSALAKNYTAQQIMSRLKMDADLRNTINALGDSTSDVLANQQHTTGDLI